MQQLSKNWQCLLIGVLILLISGCSAPATEVFVTPTFETVFSTPTLAPTATVPATATLAPPTITPTVAPLSVTVKAQVNLRSLPDSNSEVLDIINLGAELVVIGKSEDEKWLAVKLPKDETNFGWVTIDFVSVSEDLLTEINIVAPVSPTVDPNSANAGSPGGAPVVVPQATVRNEIFVRSGPGQIYADIGTIAAKTVVSLTGRNETNIWIQIKFDKSPNGSGWVAASYLDGANLTNLPFFDNQGNLIPGQASLLPTTIPSTILSQQTPTGKSTQAVGYQPAAADADSFEKPSVSVVFSPTTVKNFQFTSEVSSPSGDKSDWFTFTPYEPSNSATYVYLRLDCTGNGGITSLLYSNDAAAPVPLGLKCGNYGFALKVVGGKKYTIELDADGSAQDVRLVYYILYVDSNP